MIIDTNALSAWKDADADAISTISAAVSVLVPVIVIGEYVYGIQRSREKAQAESWLEKILAATPIAVIGHKTAALYGITRSRLRDKGRPIPDNDLWIAAIALEYNLPVLSRDAHFDHVEGLTRISW